MALPDVSDVKAIGSYVYVEVISPRELMKTKLEFSGEVPVTVNEAYVLDIGPQVPPSYGVKSGDRVFIDGGITFGPDYGKYKFSKDGRKRGMVLHTSIKGLVVEDE